MLEWLPQSETSLEQVRERYRHFAQYEAQGVSPLYEQFAWAVAESAPLLHFIAALPSAKQQPNLVFTAVRHLYGIPTDAQHLTALIAQHQDAIRQLILARATQTNEPGRCATLLPVLCHLPQPLALLEVGASAGLCLLPDAWGYDYGDVRIEPPTPLAPVFPCAANAATPLPRQLPQIAWRAGIDLNPLDLADAEAVAWLESLVWPGQAARAERLRAALRVAQAKPPTVIKGNLLSDLVALAHSAPADATLVIFHSAVLAYVALEDRKRFIDSVNTLGATWISNEAPQVLPAVAAKLTAEAPRGRFLLAVNGEPVAFTGPHGQSVEWLG